VTIAKAENPIELEFHYRDIVTVQYTRQSEELPSANKDRRAARLGKFEMGLVNGKPQEYMTLEEEGVSAVEHVRRKTRAVKSS
jgi:hypothetical protein